MTARSDRAPPPRDGFPPTPNRLIGRDTELDAAVRAVRSADGRLVTIIGTGGCGKTRLAVEIARTLSPEFADGTVFVDLADVGRPADVPAAIIGALRFVDLPGGDPVERLVSGLALQQRLIVLDNFEHLVDSAAMIAEVARRSPGSVLLVTSRRRLNVRGEQTVPLGTLAVPREPSAVDPPSAALASVASVALFCERARAVHSEFTVDERMLTTIGEICRLLDGLPLAIELTAAYTRLLPPDALLGRLTGTEDRTALGLSGRGALDAAPRHRTMRETIRWSYDLLDEPARRLLRQLAVFAGGWTLDAMEQICSDGAAPGATLDALVDLVDLNLVEPLEPIDDDARFRLLETVRLFGREQLETHGELDAAAARHAGYFAALAREVGPAVETRDGQRAASMVDRDLPNIRRALDHFATSGPAADGLAATVALAPYWLDKGPVREGRQWLDRFLATSAGSAELRATAEGWAVRFAVESGEIDASRPGEDPLVRLARARDVVAATGQHSDWLRLTEHLSYLLRLRGEFEELDRLFGEVLSGEEPTGWVEVDLMARRATVTRDRRDAATARAVLEETMSVARRTGHDRAWIRAALGYNALHDGPLATTRQNLHSIFELADSIGDHRGAAMAASEAGMAALKDDDLPAGAHWFRTGIDIGLVSGYWHAIAWAVMGTVIVATRAGEHAAAARLHGAVLPSLTAMRRQIAPGHLAVYDGAVTATADALGAETFALECRSGELGGWQLAVDNARQVTSGLLAGPDARPARPAAPPSTATVTQELTDRERQVLAELVRGHTNERIARELGVSAKTVMHHTGRLYRKLGVRGRAEAVAYALRTGLVG